MLIEFNRIRDFYKKEIIGVLHIGAHYGQEYAIYLHNNVKNIIFFEPLADSFAKLKETVCHSSLNINCYNIALGNTAGIKEMFVETANQGMSSSLLEPGTHLNLYPGIVFNQKEKIKIEKLDNIEFDRSLYNMINIDVQGYELEVFKGAAETLKHIDIVYTEINTEEVYKDCALIGDIDKFLGQYGFERKEVYFPCKAWGDAIYIKHDNVS